MPTPPARPAADAFVAAILARPDDDAPRLIWADYLGESDAPADRARAELVRVQCTLARIAPEHPRYAALAQLADRLVTDYGATWAGPLAGLVAGYGFRRGLLDAASVTGRVLACHAADLFRLAPLRRVRLIDAADTLPWLAESGTLAPIEELDLSGSELGAAELTSLGRMRRQWRVRELSLGYCGLTDRLLAPLADLDAPRLRVLNLPGQRVTGAGVLTLARSKFFANLAALDLSENRVGPGGIAPLGTATKLERVGLAGNPLGDEGARAFAESPLYGRQVSRTRTLDFAGTGLTARGAAALAEAAPSAGLSALDLSHNDLGDAGVTQLVAGPFDRLARLTLAHCRLADDAAFALGRSAVMARLAWLDVSDNRLTQAGINYLWKRRRDFQTQLVTARNLGSYAPGSDPDAGPSSVADDLSRVLRPYERGRSAAGAGGAARERGGYTLSDPPAALADPDAPR